MELEVTEGPELAAPPPLPPPPPPAMMAPFRWGLSAGYPRLFPIDTDEVPNPEMLKLVAMLPPLLPDEPPGLELGPLVRAAESPGGVVMTMYPLVVRIVPGMVGA